MTTTLPRVSVVIPTRDRPQLLAEAVDAVVAQDYDGHLEVVVVVDGVQDLPVLPRGTRTRTMLAVRNSRSPGLAGARNTGIQAGSGELVAFCDDDDRWLPQKLALQVRAWHADPQAVLISSGIRVVNTPTATDAARLPSEPMIPLGDLLRDRHAELHSSTFLMPRSALLGELGLVNEDIPGSFGEDYDLLLRAARIAPILAVQEVLVEVRWHGGSFFFERWEMMREALTWLLDQYPEFAAQRNGYARVAGQIAFASAATGDRRAAFRWAARSLRRNPWERRVPLAVLVALGATDAESVMARLNARGRGV